MTPTGRDRSTPSGRVADAAGTRPGPDAPGPGRLGLFLVEVVAGRAAVLDVQGLAELAGRGAAEVAGEGAMVRFLRVVYLPEDNGRLLLFEAEPGAAVRAALQSAGLTAPARTRHLAVVGATQDTARSHRPQHRRTRTTPEDSGPSRKR